MDRKDLAEGKHVIGKLRELEKVHPHKLLVFLFLFGLSLVYMYLLISLTIEIVSNDAPLLDLEFPKFYIVGSFLILSSVFIPVGLIQAFGSENLFIIRKKIFGLFLSGAVFLLLQGIGWLELIFQGLSFKHNLVGTYLYIITGFHMVSVLVGMSSMAIYLYLTRHTYSDGVAKLIYFTSPYERTKLEIINNFWLYTCISWIFIVTWLLFLI